MLYQIYKTKIRINTDNESIAEYISRELSCFERYYLNGDLHMIINIHNSPPHEDIVNEAVEISAFDHKSFYTFGNEEECILIDYYFPYPVKTSSVAGFFNPFFMPLWQRCLIDFFHNTFLGILECELLKHNATFLHASSFAFDLRGAHVLIGKGQTGKSSIAKWLSRNKRCSVISEDFCIITTDGFVLSYPKQCRVVADELGNTDYFSSMKTMRKLLEKIHICLFSLIPLKRFHPKRRMRYQDYFAGSDFLLKTYVHSFYILLRTSDHIRVEPCSSDLFISLCTENMKEEFQNLSAFRLYLREHDLTLDNLLDRFKDILLKIVAESDINICNIPYYKDVRIIRENVDYIFDREKGCSDK